MTPQQNIIINLLQDRQKHCPTVELFMKDDRTRISELRKMGYVFNEGAGFCREPAHKHGAKVKLRQLIAEPFKPIKRLAFPTYCCYSFKAFQTHDKQCKEVSKEESKQLTINM